MNTLNKELKSISKALYTLGQQAGDLALLMDRTTSAGGKRTAAPKKVRAKKKAAGKSVTMLDQVFDKIKGSRKGIAIAKIKQQTGLGNKQLSNVLYKLTKKGLVETKSRGVYIRKKS